VICCKRMRMVFYLIYLAAVNGSSIESVEWL
jgi:hypothetical protein